MRPYFREIRLQHITHIHQLSEHTFDLIIQCAAKASLKPGFQGADHLSHVHLTPCTLCNEGLLQFHDGFDDNFKSEAPDLHRCYGGLG
jgi:hypothetical protein